MTLELRIAALKTYLLAKVNEEDWHGVSDAANDLRVLEATKKERVDQEAKKSVPDKVLLPAGYCLQKSGDSYILITPPREAQGSGPKA